MFLEPSRFCCIPTGNPPKPIFFLFHGSCMGAISSFPKTFLNTAETPLPCYSFACTTLVIREKTIQDLEGDDAHLLVGSPSKGYGLFFLYSFLLISQYGTIRVGFCLRIRVFCTLIFYSTRYRHRTHRLLKTEGSFLVRRFLYEGFSVHISVATSLKMFSSAAVGFHQSAVIFSVMLLSDFSS